MNLRALRLPNSPTLKTAFMGFRDRLRSPGAKNAPRQSPKRNHTKLILHATRVPNSTRYNKHWTTVNGRKINASPNNSGAGSIIKINGVNYRVGATISRNGRHETKINKVTPYNNFANALRTGAHAPGVRRFGS